MAKTLIRMGNIFEGGSDLTVLPCSAKGTITSSTKTWQELFELPTPGQLGSLRLGDITDLIDCPKAKKKTRHIVYAASVLNDASSPEAIFSIGQQLGLVTMSKPEMQIVEAPLLGGGHGGLEPVSAAQALCDGFRSTASVSSALYLFVYDNDRLQRLHETLGSDYSGARLRSTPTTTGSQVTFNIGSIGQFTGVMAGEGNHASMQAGSSPFILAELARASVPEKEKAEFDSIRQEIEAAEPTHRSSIAKRGLEWVTKNASALGTLSGALKQWFEIFLK